MCIIWVWVQNREDSLALSMISENQLRLWNCDADCDKASLTKIVHTVTRPGRGGIVSAECPCVKKKKKNDEKMEEKKDEKQKRKRKEKKGRVNEWARLRNSVMTDECFWINAPLIIECAGPKLCVRCIYTYIYYIYMTRRTWSDTPQHTRRNGGKIYSVLSLYITSNQLGPSKTQSYVGKG